MPDKKPHLIQIRVVSISNGVENQIIDLEEGAITAEELTLKCFTITDSINDAMKRLCDAGGFPTGLPPGKPRN
jgi:hypothetical protein